SFVLDYNTEFQLEPWKKQFLLQRLSGKTLVVLGFSGLDLDVSEALAQVRLERLIWVCAERKDCAIETWSGGARNLVRAVGRRAVQKERVVLLNVNYQIE